MPRSTYHIMLAIALCLATLAGCARAHRDTTEYALEETITVDAPFDVAWQAVKGALRDENLAIYTRDKRGLFIAYTTMKRRFYQPNRTKYSVTLEPTPEDQTTIRVEIIRQKYGVTPLTYPGWHDRRAQDNGGARAILDAVIARLTATPEMASASGASV